MLENLPLKCGIVYIGGRVLFVSQKVLSIFHQPISFSSPKNMADEPLDGEYFEQLNYKHCQADCIEAKKNRKLTNS